MDNISTKWNQNVCYQLIVFHKLNLFHIPVAVIAMVPTPFAAMVVVTLTKWAQDLSLLSQKAVE